MDIFEGDAFSIIELTRALDNIPFKPATLSGSGTFRATAACAPARSSIESRDGTLSLIPFSERGSAYEQQVPERRDVRAFVCRQFKKQDVIWASEIQGIRAFGSDSESPAGAGRSRSPTAAPALGRRGDVRVPPAERHPGSS